MNAWIYRKFKEAHSEIMPMYSVNEIMNRNFRQIPKPVHYIALKELEQSKCLIKLDKMKVKILQSKKDEQLNNYRDLLF